MEVCIKQLLKDKLCITWTETITERKLNILIGDAQEKLKHLLGAGIDFSVPGAERELFLNYCLYAWNGQAAEFRENYREDIYEIRHKNEVKNYKKDKDIQ